VVFPRFKPLTWIFILTAVTLMASYAVKAVAGPFDVVAPETEMAFEDLGIWSNYSIEVAPSSLARELDPDGDTLSYGVFRVTVKDGLLITDTLRGYTFVDTVVGICGYDGLVLMITDVFDKQGKLIHNSSPNKTYRDIRSLETPPGQMYKKLCPPELVRQIPLPGTLRT
jgi:hypothetical protein